MSKEPMAGDVKYESTDALVGTQHDSRPSEPTSMNQFPTTKSRNGMTDETSKIHKRFKRPRRKPYCRREKPALRKRTDISFKVQINSIK